MINCKCQLISVMCSMKRSRTREGSSRHSIVTGFRSPVLVLIANSWVLCQKNGLDNSVLFEPRSHTASQIHRRSNPIRWIVTERRRNPNRLLVGLPEISFTTRKFRFEVGRVRFLASLKTVPLDCLTSVVGRTPVIIELSPVYTMESTKKLVRSHFDVVGVMVVICTNIIFQYIQLSFLVHRPQTLGGAFNRY